MPQRLRFTYLLQHLRDALREHSVPASGFGNDLVHEFAVHAQVLAERHTFDGSGEMDTSEQFGDRVFADLEGRNRFDVGSSHLMDEVGLGFGEVELHKSRVVDFEQTGLFALKI